MDPGGIDHMLPKVIAAYIHQLAGIQGASAQVGLSTGMGGNAIEDEVGTHNGHISHGAHLVHRAGVPGIAEVHMVKITGPGDKLLGTRPLFGGAAEEDHGAVSVFLLQVVLQSHSGSVDSGTQQIVPAAVAGAPLFHCLLDGAASLLAQAGQSIVLCQQAHHRLPGAASEGGGEGCGDARNALLNGKALFFQGGNQGPGRLGLLIGELGIAPDLLG